MRRLALALCVGAVAFGGTDAHAHLMNSGFGPFYDGLGHPLATPEDLLPAVALALLAGLRGASCGRFVVFALPLAWAAGMTAGSAAGLPAAPAWLTAAITIVLGASVAADRPWPAAAVTALAALAGATHGIGNGRELAVAHGGMLAMAGIACAVFVLSALIAGQVASVASDRARIVVRVAGSWIAAVGLLMFGWAMR